MSFAPKFTITQAITASLTRVERARGFIEAARLSQDWIRRMGERALILEAHHTTHIEGTRLTLDQAERLWAGERVPEAYPDDVRHFRHWNAHSVFFLDPGGNVVEYIARHDLGNEAPGPFASGDILYASEIGLIVDDVTATASRLQEVVGLSRYRGGDEQFTALGDEQGLLLVMKRGRILSFNPSDTERAARVFHTVTTLRGLKPVNYRVSGFPYEVIVEE